MVDEIQNLSSIEKQLLQNTFWLVSNMAQISKQKYVVLCLYLFLILILFGRFQVVFTSSEDAEYPSSELDTVNPQTRGWQSERHCSYPQEIGIRLPGIVRVNQLQVLSHSTKIAKRIEFLIGQGSDYENTSFRSLGYISLDDNARSEFKARELKSVHLDDTGNFMKLIIHAPHTNKYNLYMQVGIIAINVLGSLESAPIRSESGVKGSNPNKIVVRNPLDDLSIDVGLDAQTADKLRKLSEAKKHAIQIEDYMTAKQIKLVETELMKIGTHLNQLDGSKRRAVQEEDYDRAREIKEDMDQLRLEMENKVLCSEHMDVIAWCIVQCINSCFEFEFVLYLSFMFCM